MRQIILDWFIEVTKKIIKNPYQNLLILIFSGYIAYAMGEYLFSSFGLLTLAGYVFACLKGLTRILDQPGRTVIWGVGFTFGAVAIRMISDNLLPAYDKNNLVSLISVGIIAYVIFSFYLKSKELKNA
ncbi:MAG: hypothetical protein WCV90_00965 [Candidatus Woesearchaeota archaeon]